MCRHNKEGSVRVCGDVIAANRSVVLVPRAFWPARLWLLSPLISHAPESMRRTDTWARWQDLSVGVVEKWGLGRESNSHELFTVLSLSPVLSWPPGSSSKLALCRLRKPVHASVPTRLFNTELGGASVFIII